MGDLAAASAGDRIKDADTGIEYQVLFTDPAGVYVFEIRAKAPRRHARGALARRSGRNALPPPDPELWTWDECLDREQLELFAPTPHIPASRTLSSNELKYQQAVSLTFELIGNAEPEIYDPAERALLVKNAATRLGIRPSTVLAHLRAAWGVGKNLTAVVGYWHRRGAPGTRRTDNGRKLGRPRSAERIAREGVGVNRATIVADASSPTTQIPEAEYVRRAWVMQKKRAWSDSTTYDHYRKLAHPTVQVDESGRKRITYDAKLVLSLEQFRAELRVLREERERLHRQHTPAAFATRVRPQSKGISLQWQIGEVFQVDTYRTNLSATFSDEELMPMGTLVVFLITEYVTRHRVAVHVTSESEVYEGFLACIVKALRPKQPMFEKRGLDITAAIEAPLTHWCQKLVMDRGNPYFAVITDALTAVMGSNPLINLRPFAADLKGTVEGSIKDTKAEMAQLTRAAWSGRVFARDKGSPNIHLLARHTRQEIEDMLWDIGCAHGMQRRDDFPLIPEIVEAGVPTTPTGLVHWSLLAHQHRFRRLSPDEVELKAMKRFKADVSLKGISFGRHQHYEPGKLRDRAWYRDLELRGGKVELAINRLTPELAFLEDREKPGTYFRLEYQKRSAALTGLTMLEIEALDKRNRDNAWKAEMDAFSARIRVDEHAEQYEKRARRASFSSRSGNADKLRGLTENRRAEQANERAAQRARLRTLAEPAEDPHDRNFERPEELDDYSYEDVTEFDPTLAFPDD